MTKRIKKMFASEKASDKGDLLIYKGKKTIKNTNQYGIHSKANLGRPTDCPRVFN